MSPTGRMNQPPETKLHGTYLILDKKSNANTTDIISWTSHPATVSGLNSRTAFVSQVPPQLFKTVCVCSVIQMKIVEVKTEYYLTPTHLLNNNKIKQCKHST